MRVAVLISEAVTNRAHVSLACGGTQIGVEESLLSAAQPRVDAARFTVNGNGDAQLEVHHWDAAPSDFVALVGNGAAHGWVRIVGRLVNVSPNEGPYAAEACLRVGYQVSVARQGGVLVHASSVRFGPHAVVAVGQSTAGKSTLARLCREAGGELLSDEMTALFPDGTVYGTPFRSSDPTPGHPGPAKLGLFVLLDKAPHEALSPLAPEKALPRILEQVYRGYDGGELTPAKILERVAGAMNVCPPQLLSFRKDPEAGHFVRRYLEKL